MFYLSSVVQVHITMITATKSRNKTERRKEHILTVRCVKVSFSIKIVTKRSDTVQPVVSGHSIIDTTKVLKTNGSLMKVESIGECSWSIVQYF